MSRLDRIAKLLGMSVTFLLTGSKEKRSRHYDNEGAKLLRADGAIRLLMAFDRMKNRQVRKAILDVAERIARWS
jgi:hypothetical protein